MFRAATTETSENGSEILEDLNRIDSLWLAADAVQRKEWLEAIPEEARMFAPRPACAPEPVVSGGAQECFGTRFARVQLKIEKANPMISLCSGTSFD